MQLWEIEKERYQEGREAGLAEGRTEGRTEGIELGRAEGIELGRAEVVPFLIEMSIKMTGDEETSINEVANTVPSLTVEQIKSVWYEYKNR